MQFLTHGECVEWARGRKFPLSETQPTWITLQREFPTPPFHLILIKFPKDSGKKVVLAKMLYSLFEESANVLIWIEGTEIWPSSQHMPLLQRLRESLGEKRPIDKTPGHLVSIKDKDDAVSLILISLLFIWDCHILAESGQEAVHISHDEFAWFASHDPKLAEKVRLGFK